MNSLNLNDFLNQYKDFETCLRRGDAGAYSKTVLDFENNLTDPAKAEKYKTMRIVRNYASHNPDAREFLTFDGMTSYLRTETEKIDRSKYIRDFTIHDTPIMPDTSFADAMQICCDADIGFTVVIDAEEKVIGYVTDELMCKLLLAYRKNDAFQMYRTFQKMADKTDKCDLPMPKIAKADDLMVNNRHILGKPTAVVNDEGKYIGVVKW